MNRSLSPDTSNPQISPMLILSAILNRKNSKYAGLSLGFVWLLILSAMIFSQNSSKSAPKPKYTLNIVQPTQHSSPSSQLDRYEQEYPTIAPPKYAELQQLRDKDIKQLPICIVTHRVNSITDIVSIYSSVANQYGYSNYRYVYTNDQQIQNINTNDSVHVPKSVYQQNHNDKDNDNDKEDMSDRVSVQVQQLINIIKYGCNRNDVVLIARVPLKADALAGINLLYQRYNVWMTSYIGMHDIVSKTDGNMGNNIDNSKRQIFGSITSFYLPVLLNMKNRQYRYRHKIDPKIIKDVDKDINIQINIQETQTQVREQVVDDIEKQVKLNKHQSSIKQTSTISVSQLILSMRKLAMYHTYRLHPLAIYTHLPTIPAQSTEQPTPITASHTFIDYSPQLTLTKPQHLLIKQPMMILSQQLVIGQLLYKRHMKYLSKRQHPVHQIHIQQLLSSIQYTYIKYLPHNHTLNWREQQYYGHKYNIHGHDYSSSGDGVQQRLSMICVVVPSVNNVQGNRYKRVFDTIAQQSYPKQMLRVVFIDDCSTDGTYEMTKLYVGQYYPWLRDRTVFVRNDVRRYATWNIYNAVTNHCQQQDEEQNDKHEDQVVVIIDGDDQIIGRQVFRVIGYLYSTTSNWIIYTNYITNILMQGVSKQPPSPTSSFYTQQNRTKAHFISALRTFKAKLYNKINISDHKDDSGNYFDAMYDDAMQYPLAQMAGPERIMYVPEIMYLYNRFYGANDDSDQAKLMHRMDLHQQVLRRKKYHKLDNLDN